MSDKDDALREVLAYLCHEQWTGWMEYLFQVCPEREHGHREIPASLVVRWKRQMASDYFHLPEEEKKSDQVEADKIIALLTRQKFL